MLRQIRFNSGVAAAFDDLYVLALYRHDAVADHSLLEVAFDPLVFVAVNLFNYIAFDLYMSITFNVDVSVARLSNENLIGSSVNNDHAFVSQPVDHTVRVVAA